MELQGGRFVIGKARAQNAVFLTTGIITECALIEGVATWAPANSSPGALVKRVRLRPFTVEYERAAAYFGTFIDTKGSQEYGGPIYNTGLQFASRKEGADKGECFHICMEIGANNLEPAPLPLKTTLLAASPTAGASRNTKNKQSQNSEPVGKRHIDYPASMSFDSESMLSNFLADWYLICV